MRGRRSTADLRQQHVTIDHSLDDVSSNSYSESLQRLLAVRKSESSFPVQSMPSLNAALFKEQLCKQRYRVADVEPDGVKVSLENC